eukprot:11215915-Ditylum_brightwellii.AAC.1
MAQAVCLVIYMALEYLLSEEKAVEDELLIVKDHSSNAVKAGGPNLTRFKKEKQKTKEEASYTLNDPSVQFPIILTRVEEISWLAIQVTTHGTTCMYLPRQISRC